MHFLSITFSKCLWFQGFGWDLNAMSYFFISSGSDFENIFTPGAELRNPYKVTMHVSDIILEMETSNGFDVETTLFSLKKFLAHTRFIDLKNTCKSYF